VDAFWCCSAMSVSAAAVAWPTRAPTAMSAVWSSGTPSFCPPGLHSENATIRQPAIAAHVPLVRVHTEAVDTYAPAVAE
jgi:hypothetical protein